MKFKKGDYVYYYSNTGTIPATIEKINKITGRVTISDGTRMYKNIKMSNIELQEV